MYNKIIIDNFNKYASSYENYSIVQKKMAEELYELLKSQNRDFNSIFEIGCGTGYLSRLLNNNYNKSQLTLNDISINMLNKTMEKMNQDNIKYINGDFETINLKEKYDLITSNAVFQWIKDIDKSFIKIKTYLFKNGIFTFSILVKGTFHELDKAFQKAYSDLNLYFQNNILEFHDVENIRMKLKKSNLSIKDEIVKEYRLSYKDPLIFLKDLKFIGASHFKNKNVRYQIMKKMLSNYNELFKDEKGFIPVTYKVLFCLAKIKNQ